MPHEFSDCIFRIRSSSPPLTCCRLYIGPVAFCTNRCLGVDSVPGILYMKLFNKFITAIKRTAIFANATSEKEACDVSFAKHTSMSHIAGYRAANFFMMGSTAYNAPPRTLQKGPIPPTDQQAQPPSQLKKKHYRQHLKQTYCPMQHNLIHRPQQSLQPLQALEIFRPRT